MGINPKAVQVIPNKKRNAKGWLKRRASNFGRRVGGELKFHAQVTAAEHRAYREEKLKAASRRGRERAKKWETRKSKTEMIMSGISKAGKSYTKRSKGSGLFDSPWDDKPVRKRPKRKRKRYKYVKVEY